MFFSKEVLFVPVTSFVMLLSQCLLLAPKERTPKPTQITLAELEIPDSCFSTVR